MLPAGCTAGALAFSKHQDGLERAAVPTGAIVPLAIAFAAFVYVIARSSHAGPDQAACDWLIQVSYISA
jgi:hypothetical protein